MIHADSVTFNEQYFQFLYGLVFSSRYCVSMPVGIFGLLFQ